MGMQVVVSQTHMFDSRVGFLAQVLHKLRRVDRGARLTHCNIAQPGMGLTGEEPTACPMLLLCIMVAPGLSRTHGQEGTHLSNEG